MVDIFLNVYDMTKYNCLLGFVGMGAYHTGVQIGANQEYQFGSNDEFCTGVSMNTPRDGQGKYIFKKSIFMGTCNHSNQKIDDIISDFKIDFSGRSYNMIKKNCNHFSQELCMKLIGTTIPSYIFNISNCLKSIRCLISQKTIKGGFDQDEIKAKDSVYLGKKRLESQRTRDFEMSLLSSSTID